MKLKIIFIKFKLFFIINSRKNSKTLINTLNLEEKREELYLTVLITMTGSWVEYTKANKRIGFKELGKLTL